MKKPLEVSIENKFVTFAAEQGCLALKMEVRSWRNWPDRIILCRNGHVFFIEFKRPDEVPRKGQLYRHKKLRETGFSVYVCDNVEDAKAILLDELTAADDKQWV